MKEPSGVSHFRHVSCLLLASLLIAGINWWLNPHRPAWNEETLAAGEIGLTTALGSGDSVFWIDARSESAYKAGRIGEAVLLNEDHWEELLPEVVARWRPGQTVVVYCSSLTCHASHEVAKRLREEVGMDTVYVLKGGWETWLARKK